MYLKSSGFLPEVLAKLRKIDEYTKFNVNSLLIVHDNPYIIRNYSRNKLRIEIKVRVFLEKYTRKYEKYTFNYV